MGKDIQYEEIGKYRTYAILGAAALIVVVIVVCAIKMNMADTIKVELAVGDSIDIGNVIVEFDDDGNVKGANDSIKCTVNKGTNDTSLIKVTGVSEGKATIKVREPGGSTYKYKFFVK